MRWILCGVLALALALAACGGKNSGCIQSKGFPFSCDCSRRCQGTTAEWKTSTCGASSSDAASRAQTSCGGSCSPEATCTSCSCSQGVGECLYVASCR